MIFETFNVPYMITVSASEEPSEDSFSGVGGLGGLSMWWWLGLFWYCWSTLWCEVRVHSCLASAYNCSTQCSGCPAEMSGQSGNPVVFLIRSPLARCRRDDERLGMLCYAEITWSWLPCQMLNLYYSPTCWRHQYLVIGVAHCMCYFCVNTV